MGKWPLSDRHSGPATPWTETNNGSAKANRDGDQYVQLVERRFRNLPSSAGRSVFFLDKPLSWMSGQ